ncbi:hypothetical protein LI90_919 [Carbonactinospora thermoautotrophica]|uniref:EamA domain-containing protein n=1 Tax=Carbonactinospora thermoautotrophica TaxID=1469144 RepID=A0A132MNH7_9ACTN|nr:hypothetical protein LI90_919 [Carbonactinospora thermoautotrophica]
MRDMALMAVGVLAVATSGPIIAATAAPALAIAFWRNAFGTGVLLPVALARHWRELRGLGRREWRLAFAAGALLAAHFATWTPSLGMTSVASATALVTATPLWNGLIARAQGHRIPGRAWFGMVIALVGVVALTGVDFTLSPRALAGDVLALLGGALAAGYMTVGGAVRRRVSTTVYTTICYGAAALLLGAFALARGDALTGYDAGTWAKLAALTAGAQLLGHSVFNVVLKTTSPMIVSLVILLETPGATIIAAAWLGQVPPLAVVPAVLLILAGIAVVVSTPSRAAESVVPVE